MDSKYISKNIFAVVLLFLIIGVFYKIAILNKSKINIENIVTINGKNIKVDIADIPLKQQQGLSYRKDLCSECGMLFIFNDEKVRTFWMKDMNFNIDIIYMDKDKKVQDIYSNVPKEGYYNNPPIIYPSTRPSQYVLELNANKSKELNIMPGDVMKW